MYIGRPDRIEGFSDLENSIFFEKYKLRSKFIANIPFSPSEENLSCILAYFCCSSETKEHFEYWIEQYEKRISELSKDWKGVVEMSKEVTKTKYLQGEICLSFKGFLFVRLDNGRRFRLQDGDKLQIKSLCTGKYISGVVHTMPEGLSVLRYERDNSPLFPNNPLFTGRVRFPASAIA